MSSSANGPPSWVIKVAVVRFFVWLRTVCRAIGVFLSRFKFVNLEAFDDKARSRRRVLKQTMAEATDYASWEEAARGLDTLEGKDAWKFEKESSDYDFVLIETQLLKIRELAAQGDVIGLVQLLRATLLRNLAGIGRIELHTKCHVGTKRLIEDYISEVVNQLQFICDNEFPDFDFQKKLDFFCETRHAFGRSAFLLSGGAGLGMYHFGVVKALFEEGLLPKVISGSSVGSLVAAVVCTCKDEELPRFFQPKGISFDVFDAIQKGSLQRKLHRLRTKGVLQDITKLESFLRGLIGDFTFKEAYDRTGRILNITVSSLSFGTPRLLNYLTSPDVLIWSAACASCAFPGLYEPVPLVAKDRFKRVEPYSHLGDKWTDGSLQADLPMNRLTELFNINHHIVSQVNPHVAPYIRLFSNPASSGLLSKIAYLIKSEIRHRLQQAFEVGLFNAVPAFSGILAQSWEGDITIVPPLSLSDFKHIISNPTEEFKMRCQAKGQSATYPWIHLIRTRCAVENTLERCVRKLRAQSNRQWSASMRNLSFTAYNEEGTS